MLNKYLFSICLLFIFLTSFTFAQNTPNWQKSDTGLEFQRYVQSTQAQPISIGDQISFHVQIKNFQDSILVNSFVKNPVENVEVKAPEDPSDISAIFPYLAEGDSVICYLSADTLAKYSPRRLPFLTPPGTKIQYTLKILDVRSKQDLNFAFHERKTNEVALILQYAQKHRLTLESLPSGLHYFIEKAGLGPKPQSGDQVKVHYTGRLLTGKIFDTSQEEVARKEGIYQSKQDYSPFYFMLGEKEVIEGWEEGLPQISLGSRAIFLVPSHLAYGERGAGELIPPYSVLVFEIELLGIQSQEH